MKLSVSANKVKINIHTSKPGIVIGKVLGIEASERVEKMTGKSVILNITEIKNLMWFHN